MHLIADITLSGKLIGEGATEIRPSFGYAGERVACIVKRADGSALPIGSSFQASIHLPYAGELGWTLEAGEEFQLTVGAVVIGRGVVVEEPRSAL